MGRYLITRKITLHMVGAVLLATVLVLGSLWWMSTQQDRQAASSSATMIAGSLVNLETQIKTTVIDYAWWQDAYDNIEARNGHWVQSNIGSAIAGSSVTEQTVADIVAVVDADGRVLYGWDLQSAAHSNVAIIPKSVVDSMMALLADIPPTEIGARYGFAEFNGHLALLATARVTPMEIDAFADGHDFPALIMGYYLTPQRIAQLGETFLIRDLTFAKEVESPKSQLPLVGVDGRLLGYLCWTPQLPGQFIFGRVMIPVSGVLALFSLVVWAAMRNTRQLARSLASSEAEANRAARTDSLSGLPNRLALTEKIAEPETGRAAAKGRMAVIYVDINGFKAVNDTIGHSGGDIMIRQISERLQTVVPDGGFLTRIGGDEFNLILTDIDSAEDVRLLANQIIKAVNPPYSILDMQFHISGSVGYAVSNQGQWSPLEVVRHADVAMYHAKACGAQEPVAYDPALESGAFRNKQIEEALRRGLADNEINVVYQPILRAGEGSLDSVEALVRWTSKELGPISPATFIPIAEETGLIADIGQLVMRKACLDLANLPGVKLNLNISPVQLRDPMFAENMKAIADEFDVQPMRIEFELTEGIIVNHPELARKTLSLLKDAGFGLALDDFGTGFSSIGYLRRFPFDRMKIDRSFIADIGKNSKANSLLQSLITLGDALDMQVIAEGIETEEQGELITLLGCEFLQGYFYSRPIPIEEFEGFLNRRKPMRLYSVK